MFGWYPSTWYVYTSRDGVLLYLNCRYRNEYAYVSIYAYVFQVPAGTLVLGVLDNGVLEYLVLHVC